MCDAAAAGTAVGKVLIRNDRTRVTEWRFAGRRARGKALCANRQVFEWR